MQYISKYNSPLGPMTIACEKDCIIGLWFDGQKHFASTLSDDYYEKDCDTLKKMHQWLDIYFDGKNPAFSLPIFFIGTDFQKIIWNILLEIPYGKTTTYGNIANIIAKKRNISSMSARAVGSAIGKNPISILVPCHRVVGSAGTLTGYAGGISIKKALLELEMA